MCDKGCSDTEECRYDKENCEYRCYVKSVHVVVTTPYNLDSTMVTNATSMNICVTDLCNQKGSSVAATLSMALLFVINPFYD